MEPNEILKGVVGVVSLIAGVLSALTAGAFFKHRKTILRVEKRRALHKLHPELYRTKEESQKESHHAEYAGVGQ